MKAEQKTCQNCKSGFQVEPEDFDFYKKIDVPPPTWCPECRMIRRMTWRNENALYKRDCDLCDKSIITVYSPESDFAVYCRECWASDKWDGLEHGSDYDWNKDFFSQFYDLLKRTPLVSADMKGNMVNSDYGNYNANCKDCYMCFATAAGEDCCYCSYSEEIKECVDSIRLGNSELCYEIVESEKMYGCVFADKSRESSNSKFIFGSSNVNDCFLSKNLKNASYVFKNKQLSPQEYKAALAESDLGSYSNFQESLKDYEDLRSSALCRYAEIKNAPDSTGNNIANSKHVRNSFDVAGSENVKHSIRVLKDSRDIYDCQGMLSGELVYEGVGCGVSPRRDKFVLTIDVSSDMSYSMMCRNCSDCFGCVGLKDKQYCILNKQYSKEEYQNIVARIKDHMKQMPYKDKKERMYGYGEFFPSELSPFSYNETIAQDYFPITPDESESKGYRWTEGQRRDYQPTKKPEEIPDHIKDAEDSIASEIVACSHAGDCNHKCATAFRITPQELRLYKKMEVPLPRICPGCRYGTRLLRRNPFKLWLRKCQCAGVASENGLHENTSNSHQSHAVGEHCPSKFETSYAPDRPEIVYCEQCYQAEVA